MKKCRNQEIQNRLKRARQSNIQQLKYTNLYEDFTKNYYSNKLIFALEKKEHEENFYFTRILKNFKEGQRIYVAYEFIRIFVRRDSSFVGKYDEARDEARLMGGEASREFRRILKKDKELL